jgi:regulator of protease activity HflC (stomatin/prohibitin superfamily)
MSRLWLLLRTFGNIAGAVAGTLLWGFALYAFPTTAGLIVGLFLGIVAILVGLTFIPRALEPFMIEPNRHKDAPDKDGHYEKSRIGFFTDLQQGRVKVKITWNGSFVTMLMDYDGRRFEGEDPANNLRLDQQGYWKVVESGNLPDSHPLPFPAPKGFGSPRWFVWMLYAPFSIIWWAWTRLVYWFTGAVWVGIPGYRTIRIYPLERFKFEDRDDGGRVLVRKWDYSDHYRVGDFQLGVRVPSADTNDLMPVRVEFNEVGRVINPFLVAFNTDDQWPQRFTAACVSAISTYTRQKPLREVLAAKDTANAEEMSDSITARMTRSLEGIGIIVLESQYVDVSPVNDQDAEMLGDVARAQVDKTARELRAQGEASPIREIGKAMREYPEAAHIPALEAQVRTAQVAGDKAIIILGNNSGIQPMEAATLKTLREISERLGLPPAQEQPLPQQGEQT